MRNAEGFLCVFFAPPCGDTNCCRRVRPDGAALFLHRLSGVRELRQRVRPFRAGSFSLRFSGELRSAERGDSPRPAAGSCADAARAHKRVDTCGFASCESPFPLGSGRLSTCDRCGNGERQRFSTVGGTVCSRVETYSQCRIPFCYTYGLLCTERGIAVPRSCTTVAIVIMIRASREINTPVNTQLRGAWRYNASRLARRD